MPPDQSIGARIQERFGRAAAAYAVSPVHRGGPDLDAMLAAGALTGRERVLDLGCGPGHAAAAFAPHAAEVVALDLTEAMVELGRRLAAERGIANLRFERGDAARLPFAGGALRARHLAALGAPLRGSRGRAARGRARAGAGRRLPARRHGRARGPGAGQLPQRLRAAARSLARARPQRRAVVRDAARRGPRAGAARPLHHPRRSSTPWVERIGTSPGRGGRAARALRRGARTRCAAPSGSAGTAPTTSGSSWR